MALGIVPASGTWIELAGVTLCMAEWDAEFDGGLVDATTFCDGGFADWISTVKEARVSIRGFWNVLQYPHNDPPNIVAGASIANLFLGVTAAASPAYEFPLVIVDRVRVASMVRDALKLDFDVRSRGSFTYAN